MPGAQPGPFANVAVNSRPKIIESSGVPNFLHSLEIRCS